MKIINNRFRSYFQYQRLPISTFFRQFRFRHFNRLPQVRCPLKTDFPLNSSFTIIRCALFPYYMYGGSNSLPLSVDSRSCLVELLYNPFIMSSKDAIWKWLKSLYCILFTVMLTNFNRFFNVCTCAVRIWDKIHPHLNRNFKLWVPYVGIDYVRYIQYTNTISSVLFPCVCLRKPLNLSTII